MRTLEITASINRQSFAWKTLKTPVLAGMLGGLGLLIFYLGLIALAQGSPHAVQQLGDDKWFILHITAGFATQFVGLFVYLHQIHAKAHALPVAASTTTSTIAMLACCAYHLADIFPIIGLSGAALFLNQFKTPFRVAGIVMNLGGIIYLLLKIRKEKETANSCLNHENL